jgi:hypothetical protein
MVNGSGDESFEAFQSSINLHRDDVTAEGFTVSPHIHKLRVTALILWSALLNDRRVTKTDAIFLSHTPGDRASWRAGRLARSAGALVGTLQRSLFRPVRLRRHPSGLA